MFAFAEMYCCVCRFALEHKEDVRKHPTFRAQFHEMCARVGVDPLASNKGFWSEMLGLGEFYYELGVQTIEACLVTKKINGGLTELSDLRRLVQKRRGKMRHCHPVHWLPYGSTKHLPYELRHGLWLGTHTDPITEDDLVRAVEKLKVTTSRLTPRPLPATAAPVGCCCLR